MRMLKLIDSVQVHEGVVWSVAWHPKGNQVACCGQNNVVTIYQLVEPNGKVVKKLTNNYQHLSLSFYAKFEHRHTRTVRDLCWSPCGTFLALASFDGKVTIWRIDSKKSIEYVTTAEAHESEVKCVAWSPNGECIATCGRDKQVLIWAVVQDGGDIDLECESIQIEHSGDIKRVIWHPHEELLLSVGYDNKINLYKHSESDGDWTVEATVSDHTSTVWAADFDATGKRIVSCSDDKTLRLRGLDLAEVPPTTVDMEFSRPIYDVAWNKMNGYIATGCGDSLVRVFRETELESHDKAENITQLSTFDVKNHDGDVNRIQWNPECERFLISCGDDSCIKLWKLVSAD